jgi:hypothetical protein
VPLSGAKILDDVRAGASLRSLSDAHPMGEIVDAVLGMKQSLRYGVSSLDDAGLRRHAGIEPWSVAEIVGHALDADAAAHRIARALAIGTLPDPPPPYGVAGVPGRTREDLLAGIGSAEERAREARVLAAGGPTFPHPDLGDLDARGWILFIALHDALHLHQAAAVVRAPR